MTYRKSISLLLSAAAIATGLFVSTSAAAKPKTIVVGTDPAGDWGSNVDASLGPIGEPLGQDLVEASIGMADKKTINFIIKVSSLPPNGGLPEGTRYTWQLLVDGNFAELDGKWSNYSRGACDPTAGNCPPPRDPGSQPFLIRGDCTADQVIVCKELGIVQATFDAASGTITIPVPLALLKARAGTKIQAGTQAASGFSGVSATPSAFYSHSATPFDTLMPAKTFVVPR